MIQASEVRKKFSQVEQSIHQAAQACQKSQSASSEIKASVENLDKQSNETKAKLQKSEDEGSIRQYVDELDVLVDKCKNACDKDGKIDQETKNAVNKASKELSDLKLQLH